MTFEFEEWASAVFASISRLSRTAGGVSEAAYGGAKPAIVVEREKLVAIVERNLRNAIAHVWAHGPAIRSDAVHVQAFINAVATTVSVDVNPPGSGLYRTWDTRGKFPRQVTPADILAEYGALCARMAGRLDEKDPVVVAAEIEWELDGRIHPFADGCGRTAKLLGAWMLLRGDMLPAQFTDRKEYYTVINHPLQEWVAYYRAHVPALVTG